MTNFEKWKEELKPEELITEDFGFNNRCAVFFGHGNGCECCPARQTCSAQCDDEIPCESQFLSWANSHTKEGK